MAEKPAQQVQLELSTMSKTRNIGYVIHGVEKKGTRKVDIFTEFIDRQAIMTQDIKFVIKQDLRPKGVANSEELSSLRSEVKSLRNEVRKQFTKKTYLKVREDGVTHDSARDCKNENKGRDKD